MSSFRYYLAHMAGFSLRFYLPLNVVSTLIFNRKKLKENPQGTIMRVLKSVVRSASFLSLYCANAWAMQCFTRRAGWLSVYNLPIFMAVSAGPSILLEDKGRRLELAMYCLSPTLQACYNLGMQSGFIRRELEETPLTDPNPHSSPSLLICSLTVGLTQLTRTPNGRNFTCYSSLGLRWG